MKCYEEKRREMLWDLWEAEAAAGAKVQGRVGTGSVQGAKGEQGG